MRLKCRPHHAEIHRPCAHQPNRRVGGAPRRRLHHVPPQGAAGRGDPHARHLRERRARRRLPVPSALAGRAHRGRAQHDRRLSQTPRSRRCSSRRRASSRTTSPARCRRSRRARAPGFVWDDKGTIVTNFHVVEGARSRHGDVPRPADLRGEGGRPRAAQGHRRAQGRRACEAPRPDPRREGRAARGRSEGDRHRQPVRPRPHAHDGRDQRASAGRCRAPAASRSAT